MHKYVSKLNNPAIKILDTRKTTPGLRLFEKYAVAIGGSYNHRLNLSDGILIKDNHISADEDIVKLVKKAIKNKKGRIITVEVDDLNQLKKIIGLKFDRVLFDNMNYKTLRTGVKLVKKRYETEASGGIKITNIKKFALTGVDRISVGELTHSSSILDLKLQI